MARSSKAEERCSRRGSAEGPPGEPALEPGLRATVRRPDVVVVSVESYGGGDRRFDAADVVLVAEIVSPGSERTDRVTKLAEYAKAGIEDYWIVELDEPVSLKAFELVDDVYKQSEGGTGVVELTRPAPLTVDLDALLRRR
ncbi:MAG TPA: Uma2 family endonuclease [Lentzea sp.]